jgi:hypothetical protein
VSRNLQTKIFVLALVGIALYWVTWFLIQWLVPAGSPAPPRVLVALLPMWLSVVGLSVVVKTAWRRRQDGTYVETKAIRWILAGGLLLVVMLLLLGTYFWLVSVFLMPD